MGARDCLKLPYMHASASNRETNVRKRGYEYEEKCREDWNNIELFRFTGNQSRSKEALVR